MVARILAVVVLITAFISCGGMSEEEIWSKVQESRQKSDHKETLRYYQLLIDKYPNSSRIPEVLWKAGALCSNDIKDYETAVKYYKEFVNRFPDHRDVPMALFLTGFLYNNELKNVDSARTYYTEFIRRYPTNEMVESARFELEHLGKNANEMFLQPKSKSTAKKGR
ncbi:MAG: tetratricopeptide repeat protein [Bacteroidota bacterium]